MSPPAGQFGRTAPRNALTVDVEDYFHVSAFEPHIARDTWDSQPRRVEANTERVLDLFAEHDARGTFFTLGWVAERHPALVRRIVAAGHELASHGYDHTRATRQTAGEFRADITRAKGLLEDAGGVAVLGYRAPTFSFTRDNEWAYDGLLAAGYRYSSSVAPVRHDLYGVPDAPRFPFNHESGVLEIPVSTVRVAGRNLPCAGGGFFRLYPYAVTRWCLGQVNREGQPFNFYLHPWEVDRDQPRQTGLGFKTRTRHYLNLHRVEDRLARLLHDFTWDRMDRVYLQ